MEFGIYVVEFGLKFYGVENSQKSGHLIFELIKRNVIKACVHGKMHKFMISIPLICQDLNSITVYNTFSYLEKNTCIENSNHFKF